MQQKHTTLPFSLMVFIYDTAQEVKSHAPLSAGENQVEAIVSAVKSTVPDDLSMDLSDVDKSALYAFIVRGEGCQWNIYSLPEVIEAADRFFTTTDIMEQENTPASAVSILVDHDDQFRTICLSTLHLSPRTRTWLEEQAKHVDAVVDREYGFILMLHDKLFYQQVIPVDLANVIRQCSLAGYSQIVFDTESTITAALPILEVEQ